MARRPQKVAARYPPFTGHNAAGTPEPVIAPCLARTGGLILLRFGLPEPRLVPNVMAHGISLGSTPDRARCPNDHVEIVRPAHKPASLICRHRKMRASSCAPQSLMARPGARVSFRTAAGIQPVMPDGY